MRFFDRLARMFGHDSMSPRFFDLRDAPIGLVLSRGGGDRVWDEQLGRFVPGPPRLASRLPGKDGFKRYAAKDNLIQMARS